ncbi:TRAPP complex subunit trs33 [Exidia glandulosa HHB12029]|uniref:TRAPP complex subunit trs33 n=1 Tax=Exidia glandulosa HHB12029 TaxID=1314781 RepID=A0A165FIU2_EXIGL|nr:TRAPP complex subunit trs33 [Exidia glandulosa HHB12029]
MNPSTSTASLLQTLAPIADPVVRLADGALLDYLLIELVPTLADSSSVASARATHTENEMRAAGLLPARSAKDKDKEASDKEEDALRARLEAVGAHVGANLAERLSRDRARFADTLDIIKFICKDVWQAVWAKQIDNLRTNHRGVYVLQDNNFRPLSRISSHEGPQEAARRAKLYVAWSTGLIRGALARMGLQGTVIPEIPSLPQCTFQIKLPKGAS